MRLPRPVFLLMLILSMPIVAQPAPRESDREAGRLR